MWTPVRFSGAVLDTLLTQSSLVFVGEPDLEAWYSSSSHCLYQRPAKRSSLPIIRRVISFLTQGVSHRYRVPDRFQRPHDDLLLFYNSPVMWLAGIIYSHLQIRKWRFTGARWFALVQRTKFPGEVDWLLRSRWRIFLVMSLGDPGGLTGQDSHKPPGAELSC